jgi:hypothetical protein
MGGYDKRDSVQVAEQVSERLVQRWALMASLISLL